MPLYPYQEQVYDLLMTGTPVILQAPTGAGKTRAALYPFLRSWECDEAFPRKCIYAVPMRVLATQFYEEYHRLVDEYHFRNAPTVTIQTGESRRDGELTGDLIFATIDQVLSSYLLCPYSLSRRRGNMNAGAIVGAYLVFDEFHLFEPTSTLPTTLEMLKTLGKVAPYILMTATFSESMLSGLAQQLGAVVVPGNDTARLEMQALPSQDKTRHYRIGEEPLSADAILRSPGRRTLVVCNVVDRATRLYLELKARTDPDTEVVLLHSRFLPDDRRDIEDRVRSQFSRGSTTGKMIVVATQVIEVGLNITCDALHTELAPANAILQRAGRCARYQGETGTVTVYPESIGMDGQTVDLVEQAWPYQDERPVIRRTLEAFTARSGQRFTFADEQAVIAQAHGDTDRLTVEGLDATQVSYRKRMHRVMDGDRDEDAANLIRAISSQLVVIHDEPGTLLAAPFRAESFSLHPGTVAKAVQQWEATGVLRPGDVLILGDQGDVGESGASAFAWVEPRNRNALYAAPLVLLHSRLAGYSRDAGLVLGQDTGFRSKQVAGDGRSGEGPYTYVLETYANHARAVYDALTKEVWPPLATSAARVSQSLGWPPDLIERAAHLCVLFHDVGKLGLRWQRWVATYQEAIGHPAIKGEAYAHTDSDPSNPVHREQSRRSGQRPPHAVEGATAVAPLLIAPLQGVEPLIKATFSAIARHHSPFTQQGEPYRLTDGAKELIGATVEWLPADLRRGMTLDALWNSQDPNSRMVGRLLARPADPAEFLAYTILARAVRLADQAGTRAAMGRTPK